MDDGALKVTTAEQFPKSLFTDTADAHVITGASLSVTVTVWLQVLAFPWISVTVHSTVVVPTGKVLDGWLFTVVATAQLSVDDGALKVTTAEQLPKSLFTDTADAHVITGASLSVTVTSWVQVLAFPWISVTVHVTVVVPTG